MTETSEKSEAKTSKGIGGFTCSLALESGITPSAAPGGPTSGQYGQVRAHARPSRARARRFAVQNARATTLSRILTEQGYSCAVIASTNGSPTIAISGLSSDASSRSADQTASWENRLRAATDSRGSPVYKLRWRYSDTIVGGPIFRLRASARPTSGSGCGGWPTCAATDGSKAPKKYAGGNLSLPSTAQLAGWPTPRTVTGGAESAERKQELGWTASGGGDLQATAQLAGWSTPQAADHVEGARTAPTSRQKCLGRDLQVLAGWPTPMAGTPAQNGYNEAGNTDSSRKTVELLAGWPTPRADSYDSRKPGTGGEVLPQVARSVVSGETPTGSPAQTERRGQLSPVLPCWLMGLAVEWILAAPPKKRRK